MPVEPPRHGDNPAECRACAAPDDAYIWVSDRWRVRALVRGRFFVLSNRNRPYVHDVVTARTKWYHSTAFEQQPIESGRFGRFFCCQDI